MPAYAIVLIVVFSLVIVVTLIIFFFPVFRPVGKKQTPEEVAQDEVNSIIVKEENDTSALALSIQMDKDKKFINKKEKDLGIIFTDDDIESLLIQMNQDRADDLNNGKNK